MGGRFDGTDTDLFRVKSHTQQDGGGAQFRSYDFLLKSEGKDMHLLARTKEADWQFLIEKVSVKPVSEEAMPKMFVEERFSYRSDPE